MTGQLVPWSRVCPMEDQAIEVNAVSGPTRRHRVLFCIILGCLSTFFAEVISGSYPYPFTTPWGLIGVWPLYTLHTLILASIIFRMGRPRFSTLFIAGCIFGMYEAYITKVLWTPPWNDEVFRVAGVAIVELGVISFFWHPFMAFIVPLAVAVLLTSNSRIMEAMPAIVQRWLGQGERRVLFVLAIWAGLVMGGQVDPLTAVLANLIALLVIGTLFLVFMRETEGRYTMGSLLPRGRELWGLVGALAVYYIITGVFLSPENLPGLGPQLAIVLVYAVLIIVLKVTIDVGRTTVPAQGWRPHIDRGLALQLFAVYTATALASSLSGIGLVFLMISWIVWGVLAILCLGFSVKDAFWAHPAPEPIEATSSDDR